MSARFVYKQIVDPFSAKDGVEDSARLAANFGQKNEKKRKLLRAKALRAEMQVGEYLIPMDVPDLEKILEELELIKEKYLRENDIEASHAFLETREDIRQVERAIDSLMLNRILVIAGVVFNENVKKPADLHDEIYAYVGAQGGPRHLKKSEIIDEFMNDPAHHGPRGVH